MRKNAYLCSRKGEVNGWEAGGNKMDKHSNSINMKKLALLTVAMIFVATAWGQVLYSISGNKLKKKSYIVGTHHLVDADFAKKIPGMEKAMDETDQVYGELKITDLLNPDTAKMMQEALLIPDGMTIKELLTPECFEKLNKIFESITGVPFDHPQIYEQMGRMRPSVLESQLAVLMYLSEHQMAFDPTKAIDSYFQNEALANKKKAYGLESFKFQVEMMYLSKPIDEEIKSFMCTLDNYQVGKEQLNMLTEAYIAQDADKIDKVLRMQGETDCAGKEDMERLIDKRNIEWIKKMPDIMKEMPTLFVVGAGHLFGEHGVLELLRNEGYKIEAVK